MGICYDYDTANKGILRIRKIYPYHLISQVLLPLCEMEDIL